MSKRKPPPNAVWELLRKNRAKLPKPSGGKPTAADVRAVLNRTQPKRTDPT